MAAPTVFGDEVLEVEHFDPNWRLPLPGGEPRLSSLTVMDYFCDTTRNCPGFYDTECDNELVVRQPAVSVALTRLNEQEANLFHPGRWSFAAYQSVRRERRALLANALRSLGGVQYELVDALTQEDRDASAACVYVVQKVRRQDKNTTHPVAVYIIIDGIIRRSPDMHTLVQARLAACARHLACAAGVADKLARRQFARMVGDSALRPDDAGVTDETGNGIPGTDPAGLDPTSPTLNR